MFCNNKMSLSILLYHKYNIKFPSRGHWRHCWRKGLSCGLWMVHGVSSMGVRLSSDALPSHAPRTIPLDMDARHSRLLPSPGPCLIFLAHSSPPTQGCLPRSPNTVALKTEILHALVLLLYLFPIPFEFPSSIAFLTPPVSLNPLYIHTLSYLRWLICTLEGCVLLVP